MNLTLSIFIVGLLAGCSTSSIDYKSVEQPYPVLHERGRIITSDYELRRIIPAADYGRLVKKYFPRGFYMDYDTGLIYAK